jgi:hypothetical protein
MSFDDETTDATEEATNDAKADILAAIDGSTLAGAEAEEAAESEDDAA